MRPTRFLVLSMLLALAACDGAADADGGAPPDAGFVDAASEDAGADAAVDASPTPMDGGRVLDAGADPLVAISGMCGVLDDELTSATPHFIEHSATYPEGWTIAMSDALSDGAQQILADGTAGGSSGYSEAFAFEILHRCEGAAFVKSETEIEYTTTGSITDILVEIDGERVGVSVTRAVNVTGMCTRADTYPDPRAMDLLSDKLAGVNESSMNVAPADTWTKQILFVHADTETAAMELLDAWNAIDATLRADTIVYVSVSEGMDEFLYFEDRCD